MRMGTIKGVVGSLSQANLSRAVAVEMGKPTRIYTVLALSLFSKVFPNLFDHRNPCNTDEYLFEHTLGNAVLHD